MKRLATATVQVEVPEDAHVGDEFLITGDARIVTIRDHLIEVEEMGRDHRVVSGGREYEFLVLNGRLAAQALTRTDQTCSETKA